MTRPSPYISVLLPVYNERENLAKLVDELDVVLKGLKKPFEIIVVDDGSHDGSSELLAELVKERPYIKGIFFRANTGQTAALDAGFRHASGEIIVTMDSDRQNDPADIPAMVALLNEGYDCVSGWRKDRKDGMFLRKIPSKIANAVIRRLWRSSLHDLGCSLKVYRREITQELRLYGEMHRFIGILIEGLGAKVAEYVVHHRPRVAGYSKYNLTRTFKVMLDLTTIWFLQGYRTKPIYVFGGLGGLCLGTTSLIGIVAIIQKIVYETSLNRNPLFYISIFMTVLGVQFIVMGLLAELLIRNYFETSNRAPYSILKKLGFDGKATMHAA